MVNCMPKNHVNRSEYGSLLFFAVLCGARTITLEGIQLKDIIAVETPDEVLLKVSAIIGSALVSVYFMYFRNNELLITMYLLLYMKVLLSDNIKM